MAIALLRNVDLQPLNTLALPARANYFCKIETLEQLREAIAYARENHLALLVLGGGSNVILRGDWSGIVLQIAMLGRAIERRDNDILVTVGAGENWSELVRWTLHEKLYGLENLTLIPGTAGAAPIQNIGAYGVELSNVLESVRGFSLVENRIVELHASECQLGYRDSIFKNALRDRFIVTEIVLRLRTQFVPVLSYPALREQLSAVDAVSAELVEQTVRAIRQSKLPDPARLPNVGSFFKNPIVAPEQFAQLAKLYPDIPSFPAAHGVKIPAAWLVDRCGWKGRRSGHVGVHAQQALVLIHYGDGSGAELLTLAEQIKSDVLQRFGVALELEPVVYA